MEHGAVFVSEVDVLGSRRDDEPMTMPAAEQAMHSIAQLQETGVLPLTIRIPRSGVMHQFNRVMAAQDALELTATFVHVPSWATGAGFGILCLCLFPVGAMAVARFRKA